MLERIRSQHALQRSCGRIRSAEIGKDVSVSSISSVNSALRACILRTLQEMSLTRAGSSIFVSSDGLDDELYNSIF